MPPTRLLPLLVLAALAACDGAVSTAPDSPSALRPSFSAQSDGEAGWSDDAVVLDFESLATAGPIVGVGPVYTEDGYTLSATADGVFSSVGSTSPDYAGSAGLFLNDVRNLDVILTRDDGRLFSAESIDLAPVFTHTPGEVTFVGTRTDGTTVTQTHVTGTEFVFAPYALDGFTSLVELRWTQRFTGFKLHQFDNIVLSDAQAASKEDCFDDGWQRYGFRNQGECMRVLRTGRSNGRG